MFHTKVTFTNLEVKAVVSYCWLCINKLWALMPTPLNPAKTQTTECLLTQQETSKELGFNCLKNKWN